MRYRRVKMARAVKRIGAIIGSQRANTCKNEGDYREVSKTDQPCPWYHDDGRVITPYLRLAFLRILINGIRSGLRWAPPRIRHDPPTQLGVALSSCADGGIDLSHGADYW